MTPPTSSADCTFLQLLPPDSARLDEDRLDPVLPTAGVYWLYQDARLVYIGQSSQIRTRLKQHRDEGVKKFNRALWYPVSDLSMRLRMEGILILATLPSYNRAVTLGCAANGTVWDTTRNSFGASRPRFKKAAGGRRRQGMPAKASFFGPQEGMDERAGGL